MALLIYGATECALCGKVLQEGDELVATSHFIGDGTYPLWRYSDAGMHKQCFLLWGQRQEFVRLFNETLAGTTSGNGIYHFMLEDGTVTRPQR